jgi:pre-mRNA-processing factor 17
MGHGGAVKDVSFNNNGSQFLSCSYDKYVKIWDTETGQCVQAFSSGKVPNVAKFNPDEDKQHIFLAGMQDKKIIQVCAIVHGTTQLWHFQALGGSR